MKKYLLFLAFSVSGLAFGQNESPRIWETTQVNVNIGFSVPLLYSGVELMRAETLRENGLSYYQNAEGSRRSVGEYSNLSGFTMGFAFYKPIRKVKGLMLGAKLTNVQTGTQPAQGGEAEAYYFNFLQGTAAAKYYPIRSQNLFVNGEFGIASVFTKNRFLNSAGEQNFFHQFGIGTGFGVGIGYDLTPFRNKTKALTFNASYQNMSTRVEVNGIGDDRWEFGALNFTAGVTF
jgi:hypothetical protein